MLGNALMLRAMDALIMPNEKSDVASIYQTLYCYFLSIRAL